MSQQALPNQDPGRRGRPGYYGVPPASAAAAVPAAFPAPAATVSAGLPPGDGPIPLTQGSVVLRRWATPSSAVTTVLMVIVVVSAGVLLLAWGFFRLTSGGDAIDLPRRITVALLPGLPGLLLLAAVPLMLSRRTVLDARGIHVSGVLGTRDHPWPSSRRSFHVRVTSAGLVNLVESAEGGIGCLIGVVMVMAVFLIINLDLSSSGWVGLGGVVAGAAGLIVAWGVWWFAARGGARWSVSGCPGVRGRPQGRGRATGRAGSGGVRSPGAGGGSRGGRPCSG